MRFSVQNDEIVLIIFGVVFGVIFDVILDHFLESFLTSFLESFFCCTKLYVYFRFYISS